MGYGVRYQSLHFQKGMLQLYNLGQWMRSKYGFTIGRKFENTASLVLSSFRDRCIMSAQALLAGLFPPSPEDMFLPDLAWIPVPVHSIPRNLDKVHSRIRFISRDPTIKKLTSTSPIVSQKDSLSFMLIIVEKKIFSRNS